MSTTRMEQSFSPPDAPEQPSPPQDEPVGEERQRIKKQMNTFFHTVDKFVLLLRVYPTGHPLVENFAVSMIQQLREYFKQHDTMYVRVKATELLTEWDEPFFTRQESEREHFLWYIPSLDGLVGFEIPKSVPVKEMVKFLSAISKANSRELPIDDDTITILWDYDLQHIQIHAIENYLSADDSTLFDDMDGAEALVTIMGAVIDPDGEESQTLRGIFQAQRTTLDADAFTRSQYDPETILEVPAVPPNMLADAFRVDTSWSRDLAMEWTSGDNLEYRLIEALLSIVRTDPFSEPAIQAIETISEILSNMLDTSEYEKARPLFELIHKREPLFGDNEEHNPLSLMMASIIDPMRIEALLFQAQKYHEDRDAIRKIFRFCKKDTVQHHVLTMLAAPERDLLDVDLLADILLDATVKSNELQWLHEKYVSKPIYYKRLLPTFERIPIAEYQIVQRLLARALDLDDREIRARVIALADSSWCSSLIIEKYIKPCMNDEDPDIRKLAIDAVRRLDEASFHTWLKQAMDFDALGFRPPSEVLFLLRYYIELEPENIARLRDMLQTKGWFNEKRRKLARHVSHALLEHGDRQTFELLEKQSKSFFLAPALKEEYAHLIARFRQRFSSDGDASASPTPPDPSDVPMS